MSFVSNIILNLRPCNVVNSVVRWASKKAGGSSRNRKGHAPGKRRGIKAQDGTRVTQSSILLRQLNIRCHPGLNVGIGKDGSLYALQPGKVLITCEKFQPNFDKYWTDRVYRSRKENMANVYKKYFHVIPDPLEPKFRLVETV
ncbi:39S ribosomal protein L27, mitochondrial [Daphnia magna]|uniref:Large ribosomal subunit protein bL27m n=1 Tax=Daphnia magna TaxID=35525 RepID=A0A164TX28_9CRUS|nr:39S ribosomal protein L27, mitochondrial [Daphnia magna]